MSKPKTDTAAIRQVIRALRAAGHRLLSVGDGAGRIPVQTETAAIEAITAVGDAHLYVALPDGVRAGWVFFVLGNSPDEVVNDYSANLDPTVDDLLDSWG